MRKNATTTLLTLGLAATLGLGGVGLACRSSVEHGAAPAAQPVQYHCPMHPTYVADKPGDCPICGMKLVPVESSPAPAPSAPAAPRKVAYYRSPMDPSVHSPVATKDSMGMDFVPVYEDELAGAPAVSGRAVVSLSPERRQVLGLRSEAVRRGPLSHTIRTVGRVVPDETRVHHVHTKYEAYVEHLYVDYTGKEVRKGQPLLALYSPDLVATQQEYLLAYRAQQELARSGIPSAAQGSVNLLEAARQRLLLWDIRPADIDRLQETGQVTRTLDLYADMSGWVVQKTALHGMRVTPADTLFEIADYSHLWVLADVYESDLSSVRLGMPATLTMSYLPGRTWRGRVTWIAPTVDAQTRTIKVRVEVDNGGGELKPEMFADVELASQGAFGLLAPDGAFLRSGERTLAFVDLGDGRLEPREVRLGARVGSELQVLSGLAEGERVVTAANFLLDSESSLKAALSALSSPAPATSPAPAGHAHPER